LSVKGVQPTVCDAILQPTDHHCSSNNTKLHYFSLSVITWWWSGWQLKCIYFKSIDLQGVSKKVSCCTVSTAYLFLSHPVNILTSC